MTVYTNWEMDDSGAVRVVFLLAVLHSSSGLVPVVFKGEKPADGVLEVV